MLNHSPELLFHLSRSLVKQGTRGQACVVYSPQDSSTPEGCLSTTHVERLERHEADKMSSNSNYYKDKGMLDFSLLQRVG